MKKEFIKTISLKKRIILVILFSILAITLIYIAKYREIKIQDIKYAKQQKMENAVNYSKLKVGDYVSYDPKKSVEDEDLLSYTIDEESYTVQEGIKWRVLNIDEQTGKIELISTTPVMDYTLGAEEGFLYINRNLNRLCSIYGYGYGADRENGTIYTMGGPWEKEINVKILGTAGRALNVDDVNYLHNIGEEKNGTTITTTFKDLNSDYGTNKHYECKNTSNYGEVDLEGDWRTPSIRGKSTARMVDVIDTYYSYNVTSDLINSELLASTAVSTKVRESMNNNILGYIGEDDLCILYCLRTIKNGKVDAEPVGSCVNAGEMEDIEIPYAGVQAVVRLKGNLKFYLNSDLETGGTESNPWQIQ